MFYYFIKNKSFSTRHCIIRHKISPLIYAVICLLWQYGMSQWLKLTASSYVWSSGVYAQLFLCGLHVLMSTWVFSLWSGSNIVGPVIWSYWIIQLVIATSIHKPVHHCANPKPILCKNYDKSLMRFTIYCAESEQKQPIYSHHSCLMI